MADKIFTWDISKDSTESTSLSVTKTQFGDGYEQAVSFGINNARKAWQCSHTNQKPVIDAMYQFLLGTQGVQIFEFKPIATENAIKVRLDGEIHRKQIGGDVWQIDFNLRQVF